MIRQPCFSIGTKAVGLSPGGLAVERGSKKQTIPSKIFIVILLLNGDRIVDINPLPGLSPYYSDLPILYRLAGKSYSDLIKIILKESFARYGLQWVEPHKTHLSVSYE